MDRYDAKRDRGEVAARLGGREGVPRLERAECSPKSYVLEMLPYPSGTLHMGHMLVYTIGDVVTRFRARNGMHVLHPQGFDSFGLPAENAAIREGVHPRESTERNIEAHHALVCGASAGRTTGIGCSRRTTRRTTAGSSGSSCASSSAGSRTARARR